MNYTDSVSFLNSIGKYGSKLGLDNMYRLLKKLDNPQNSLEVIHVAGTNGKGSVCTMLSIILQNQGYQVGLYTSPHITNYNESIKLNNMDISNEDFAKYTSIIKDKCDELVAEDYEHPTVFECQTAIAYLYLSQEKVDFLVLEVGLGGRYDATNVIDKPLLSVITSISLDHTNYLGSTLEAIAYEKGGIIKHNCPIVLSPNPLPVVYTIKGISNDKKAKLYYSPMDVIEIHVSETSIYHTIFSITTPYYEYKSITLSLIGSHQLINATTVLHTIKALQDLGITISVHSIYSGFKKAIWPCRLEFFNTNPPILLDGAHNVEAIKTLADVLKSQYNSKPITLIFGVLKDKDYEDMIEILFPIVHSIIITKPLNDRALSLDVLNKHVSKNYSNVKIIEDYKEAIKVAMKNTDQNGIICCAGSLHLVGHIRHYLTQA